MHVIVGPLVGHINNIFGLNLSGGSVSISMYAFPPHLLLAPAEEQTKDLGNERDGDGCAKVAASLEIIIACVHIVLT